MSDSQQTSDSSVTGVELDPDQLSAEALRGLVEEYVTREGTDYGPANFSLEDKVGHVFRQLEEGDVRIVFDLELQTASIVSRPDLEQHLDRDSAEADRFEDAKGGMNQDAEADWS